MTERAGQGLADHKQDGQRSAHQQRVGGPDRESLATPQYPARPASSIQVSAYGAWVQTWSSGSQPEAAADRIVVSLIGEQ